MKRYNILEMYNLLILEGFEDIPKNHRHLVRASESDVQVGNEKLPLDYIADTNKSKIYEQVYEIDDKFNININDNRSNYSAHSTLVCVIRGNRLTKDVADKIIKSTASKYYYDKHLEYYKTNPYIGPLKIFELFTDFMKDNSKSGENVKGSTIPNINWIRNNGEIHKTFAIQFNKPRVLDMIFDLWNLATAFPELDMQVYVLRYGDCSKPRLLDTFEDNKVAYDFAKSVLFEEEFEKYFACAFSVKNGIIKIMNIDAAKCEMMQAV